MMTKKTIKPFNALYIAFTFKTVLVQELATQIDICHFQLFACRCDYEITKEEIISMNPYREGS